MLVTNNWIRAMPDWKQLILGQFTMQVCFKVNNIIVVIINFIVL